MKKATFSLILLLVMGVVSPSFAQERAGVKAKEETAAQEKILRKSSRIVQGEVSSINKRSIAVVTRRNVAKGEEDEVVVLLDANTPVANKDSLSQIEIGDTVRIQFDDLDLQLKDKRESRSKATQINFIKQGVKPKPVVRESAPQQ